MDFASALRLMRTGSTLIRTKRGNDEQFTVDEGGSTLFKNGEKTHCRELSTGDIMAYDWELGPR